MIKNKYGLKFNKTYYIFDLVTSFSITDSSSITEYPLINREVIADHKVNDPLKISISGTIGTVNNTYKFSNLNKKETEEVLVLNKDEYIKETYKFFSKLKNENVFVDVWTPTNNINNCLITDFTWNDMGTHVEWTMNLTQVKLFAFKNESPKVIDKDPSLPELNDLVPQSFVEGFLLENKAELTSIIMETLTSKELLEKAFVEYMTHIGKSALVLLGVAGTLIAGVFIFAVVSKILAVGVAAATIGTLGAAAGAGIAAIANPIGLIIIGVVALVAAVAYFIYAVTKWIEKQKRRREFIREFSRFKTEVENKREVKRFSGAIERVFKYLRQLNNPILTYKIKSNVQQELNLAMNGDNYLLKFTRQSKNATWKWSINKYDESEGTQQTLVAEKSIYALNDQKAVFTAGFERMYFVWDFLYDPDSKETPEELRNDISKLNIVVTQINMEELKEKIGQIALQAMRIKQG